MCGGGSKIEKIEENQERESHEFFFLNEVLFMWQEKMKQKKRASEGEYRAKKWFKNKR